MTKTQAQRRTDAIAYADDVERGQILDEKLLAEMASKDGHAYPLGWKVRDLIEARQFGGVEIGMLKVVARAAIAGRNAAVPACADSFVLSFLGLEH